MAKTYCNELQQALVNTSVIDGKTKAYQATIDLASQASGSEIVVAKARQGEKFVAGIITSDTSLATATVKIGTKDDDDKYKAAAVFTATNTPTLFGNAAAMAALAADEEIMITTGTAALPASGTLKVSMIFAVNN